MALKASHFVPTADFPSSHLCPTSTSSKNLFLGKVISTNIHETEIIRLQAESTGKCTGEGAGEGAHQRGPVVNPWDYFLLPLI